MKNHTSIVSEKSVSVKRGMDEVGVIIMYISIALEVIYWREEVITG